jgi:hypothetical protein
MSYDSIRPNDTERTMTVMIDSIRPGSSAMHLINEALARARMRSPQAGRSEAPRSARNIAIQARHEHARELGHLIIR